MSEQVVDTVDIGGGFTADVVKSIPDAPVGSNGTAKARKPRAKKPAAPKAKSGGLRVAKPKVVKANKPTKVKVARPAKSDAAAAKERQQAKAVGVSIRGLRILRAIGRPEARLTYGEIAAKSGVIANHLSGQISGDGEWGAGKDALAKDGDVKNNEARKKSVGFGPLVKITSDEFGNRVSLTARGLKALEKAKSAV